MAGDDRPLGITIIAIFFGLLSGTMLLVAMLMSKGIGFGQEQSIRLALAARAPYLALASILPGALAFGFWTLQNWARMITIAFSALYALRVATRMMVAGFLAGGIFGVKSLPFAVAVMVVLLPITISAAMTFYLLRPQVARAFLESW